MSSSDGAAPSPAVTMESAAAPTAEPAPRAAVQPPARPAPVKLVVAVDLDEVLGAFVEGLAAFHNKEYGTGACLRALGCVGVRCRATATLVPPHRNPAQL